MSVKKKYRVLLAVLAAAVLLCGGGVVYYHGEWWFPALYAMRRLEAPDLNELTLDGARLWTLEELVAQENVTLSNNLLLVNASHPLPEGYTPELIEYNGAKMHPLMRDPYVAMRDDIQARTGVRIYVASDYRTPEEQQEILNSSEEGIAAPLGCSEHEAGLALDVYAPYHAGINVLRSRAGRLLPRVCADYGYIIRYPFGKEEITGISYEPWHVRYVGVPHAEIMTDAGLTMEEYVEALTPGTWYQSGKYQIARLSADALRLPVDFTHCDISPDNTGYYIVTVEL
ncbi:MAG: M15 family metallopeptidase [Clostridia bacterium]|nr:M15 family metallopeptidase [Clostridia bacterium]